MKHGLQNRNTQRGAVLAVGLILLVVATLVTLTAMNTGVMQERMTANQDNNARSFMAAEAGGAELVVAWLDEISWPTNVTVSGTVGGDPLIGYEVTRLSDSWTDSPLNVLIEGRALAADNTLLARTELLLQLERGDPPPPGGPPPVNPPAAISCFNGPCTIKAGAGRGADVEFGTVSGFNHPVPPLDCTGAGCRLQPQDNDRILPAVPAVFLTHPDGSSVGLQGGNHNAYQGLNQDGTAVVIGRDMTVAKTSDDYPLEPAPLDPDPLEPDPLEPDPLEPDPLEPAPLDPEPSLVSTAPTWESVFPEPDFPDNNPQTQLESGNTSIGGMSGNDTEVGILVVNGEDLVVTGTSLFVGLIVIRDCGTLQMKGNPNVYGAIIVDAKRSDGTSCGPNYDPFGGSGTPAVRFSRAPLSGPPDGGTGTGTGGSTGVRSWSELL